MQSIDWLLAFVAGTALGSFFFGSLWLTVRELPTTGWPIRLVIGSYVGRMVIAFLGFYLIVQGGWHRAIAGLLGFLVMRLVFVRRLQPTRHQLFGRPG